MASTVLPPTSQHEAKDDTPAQEPGSAPAPVLREGAVSTSSPPAISPTSSSELGLPGTFPRDPHVPLDRLSEKAPITTEEVDSDTLLGAAREDVRRAVDAAAQYLPEGVVGAIGSVLAVGTLDSAEAEKKLDTAQTSESSPSGRTRTTFSGFDPSKVGVAGIATDLNLPSKSLEAPAPTTAARRASEPSSTAAKPAFVSYMPGPVITGSTPSPDRNETPSTTQKQEDYPAFVTYAPGPVVTDTPPSDDDDTIQKETQSSAKRDRPDVEPGSAKDSSKKKGAVEAAALGAGIGTLGGAAYKRSTPAGQAEEPAKQSASQETAEGSRDVCGLPKVSDVPAPAVASKEPIQEGAKAQRSADTDASNDATKKREALQAAALGAGIGTVGGAAYEYSRPLTQAPKHTTSNGASGLGANVKVHPDAPVPTSASKELQNQTHIALPPTQVTKPTTQNEKPAAVAATVAVPATVSAEKEAKKEPSAFADDKQPVSSTDKDKDKDAPPVLAPVASSDKKSDKESKKEAKRLEEEKKKAEKKAEKERQEKEKEVAAAAAAAEAAKKRAQKEAKEREKEMKKEAKTKEKEEKKSQKEAEKEAKEREMKMKRQEKEAGVAAVGGVGTKEVKDAKRDQEQPEEKAEKKEENEGSKEISGTRTKDEAAAAAAATLAAASAEREHKRKASVDSPPQSNAAQADQKQATDDLSSQKHPGAIEDKTAGTGKAADNEQLKEPAKDETRGFKQHENNDDKSKTKTKERGTAATAVAGATAATTAAAVDSANQKEKQKPSVDDPQQSKDATVAPEGRIKPTRPGPTALSNERSPAKSGSDSDFPLPSEGAPTTAVRAVDISGKGPSAIPPLVTVPEKGTGIAKTISAPAVVSEQSAPPPEHDRKRYHGTEGLQEKYEGGALKSSFIKRRSGEEDREEESPGGASDKIGKDDRDSAKERSHWEKEQTKDEKSSGSGKKEGIVKHIVEKVKDKLHHH